MAEILNKIMIIWGFFYYLICQLFLNCGFTSVHEDGLYIYKRGNLLYVNGKGAAHGTDVLMDPPVQMPFAYPSWLFFDCKFYSNFDCFTNKHEGYRRKNAKAGQFEPAFFISTTKPYHPDHHNPSRWQLQKSGSIHPCIA